MKLSTLAVMLGLAYAAPQIFGLLRPARFIQAVRAFPRSEPWGYALMGLGTVWFLWNVQAETISDFASYKKGMLIGFGLLGLSTCVYVRDFLAIRGLSVVMLLLAHLVLETARWNESSWRLVLSVWAYIWIIAAMWFTISPWRLRDLLYAYSASEKRVKQGSALRLAFGLFVAALGLWVY